MGLPEGWTLQELKHLCKFENGDRGKNYPNRSVLVETGIPFINAGHLVNEKIDLSIMSYIPRERYELLSNGKIKKNDILYCLRGSLGKFAIVDNINEGAIASSLVIIRPNSSLNFNYLAFYLASDLCRKEILKYENGAAQPNLSAKSLALFRIPLPSLSEQKRIVAILDEAFAGISQAIANTEKNLANARELFESCLDSLLSNSSSDYKSVKLSEACCIESTLVDPKNQEFQQLIHIGAGNIESNTGKLFDLKTAEIEQLISGKFLFDQHMVLYSKIRPYLRKVCRPDFSGLCSADIYPLMPYESLSKNYLFYLLLSKNFTDYAISGSDRAGMPKVNRPHLFNFSFTLPTKKRQEEISLKLDSILNETQIVQATYQQKLQTLVELKQSLLQKAFSGELTANNVDKLVNT